MDLLGYIVTAIAIIGSILNARQKWYGFIFWIVSNIFFIILNWMDSNYYEVIFFGFCLVLCIYGIYQWKKDRKTNIEKLPKLYIYTDGGLIQSMISDSGINLMILDGDIDGCDEDELKKIIDFGGITFKAYECVNPEVEVDKEITDHYFKQKGKK